MSSFIELPASKVSISARNPVRGIGINDAHYLVCPEINGKRVMCPFYRVWKNMLQRCYSEKYHQRCPTYIGCTVIKEWLLFSAFKGWMINQNWKRKELDKDIKSIGNKIYSPENCLFVSRSINMLMNDNATRRGEYPIGVSFHNTNNKFQAHCSHNGKSANLGYYNTPEEASVAYLTYKHSIILEVASMHENNYIKKYIINNANKLLEGVSYE